MQSAKHKWNGSVLDLKDANVEALHAHLSERNAYIGWMLQYQLNTCDQNLRSKSR